MLYDKRWGRTEIKPGMLTLEGVTAWLETKNPQAKYDYNNCTGKCLYGQYMASFGVPWEKSGGTGLNCGSVERSDFCDLVYDRIASCQPYTFGAALSRARKALHGN